MGSVAGPKNNPSLDSKPRNQKKKKKKKKKKKQPKQKTKKKNIAHKDFRRFTGARKLMLKAYSHHAGCAALAINDEKPSLSPVLSTYSTGVL